MFTTAGSTLFSHFTSERRFSSVLMWQLLGKLRAFDGRGCQICSEQNLWKMWLLPTIINRKCHLEALLEVHLAIFFQKNGSQGFGFGVRFGTEKRQNRSWKILKSHSRSIFKGRSCQLVFNNFVGSELVESRVLQKPELKFKSLNHQKPEPELLKQIPDLAVLLATLNASTFQIASNSRGQLLRVQPCSVDYSYSTQPVRD